MSDLFAKGDVKVRWKINMENALASMFRISFRRSLNAKVNIKPIFTQTYCRQ